jgi:alpha-beta hydrolase superfamily lysophospholipase
MPDVTGGQKAAAKFFGTVFPGLAAQKVDDAAFVRTEGAKQGLASDKLITHDDLPAASARAAIIAIENLTEAQLAKWSIPILIMHGTADVTTNVEGSKLLAAKAAVADKTLKLWPGTAHDLLHEPESAAVIETTRGWLDAHARAPTAVEGAASAPAPEAEPLPKHEP